MKSDREFLDGIYEKAKKYEEDKQSAFQKRYHAIKPIYLAAMLILMVTSGVVLYQQPWKEKAVVPEVTDDNVATPTTEPVSPMVRGLPFSLPVVEEVIIEGKVTSIIQEQQEVHIQIKEIHAGSATNTVEIVLYVPELETFSDYFTEQEEVLVYVQEDSEGKWILSQGMGSKYTFIHEEDGIRYYENEDELTVNTGSFPSED